jgi:hypothetical protein
MKRRASLLVAVAGLSGTTYPPGTSVIIQGRGSTADGFVNGDWLPLAWWEFTQGDAEETRDPIK